MHFSLSSRNALAMLGASLALSLFAGSGSAEAATSCTGGFAISSGVSGRTCIETAPGLVRARSTVTVSSTAYKSQFPFTTVSPVLLVGGSSSPLNPACREAVVERIFARGGTASCFSAWTTNAPGLQRFRALTLLVGGGRALGRGDFTQNL